MASWPRIEEGSNRNQVIGDNRLPRSALLPRSVGIHDRRRPFRACLLRADLPPLSRDTEIETVGHRLAMIAAAL
jgi:hypothetical protein